MTMSLIKKRSFIWYLIAPVLGLLKPLLRAGAELGLLGPVKAAHWVWKPVPLVGMEALLCLGRSCPARWFWLFLFFPTFRTPYMAFI